MKKASIPNQMDRHAIAQSANRIAPPKPIMLAIFKLRIGPTFEPKQSAQDLAAIKGINRNQIKTQQPGVHEPDGQNKLVEIWVNCFPVELGEHKGEQSEQRK